MDQKEILERIDAIKKELAENQFEIIIDKILERKFHHHKSDRKFLMGGRMIESMRKKLMLEVEMILEPALDNQREINLRFLEEIRRIKNEIAALQKGDVEPVHAQHNQKDPSENQK